jgi:signal transduction histidine kinase
VDSAQTENLGQSLELPGKGTERSVRNSGAKARKTIPVDVKGCEEVVKAIRELTGAAAVLLWNDNGATIASRGWDVERGAAAAFREELRSLPGVTEIRAGVGAADAVTGACPEACEKFVFVPLGDGAGMLLGAAAGRNLRGDADLAAAASIVALAAKPRFDEEALITTAQLATVSEIVSGIAHDIGTPLNVISGYSEYLLMSAAPEAAGRKEITTILDQTRRIAQMIRQMLDIVRPAPGQSGRKQPVATLADNALQVSSYMLRKALVKSKLETDGAGQTTVAGDQQRLQQALYNVFRSAACAAGSNGKLVLRTVAADEGIGIEIECRDATGREVDLSALAEPGVAALDAEHVGLALAARILDENGGALVAIPSDDAAARRLLVRLGSLQ